MLTRFAFVRATTAFCLVCAVGASAWAQTRSAEDILKDIEATPIPKIDSSKARDRSAETQAIFAKRREAFARRAKLGWELFLVDPDNEQLPALLPWRWLSSLSNPATRDETRAEMAKFKAGTKNAKFKSYIDFIDVGAQVRAAAPGDIVAADKAEKAVEAFIAAYPKDPRGGLLLEESGSWMHRDDEQKQIALAERIIKDYSDSVWAKRAASDLRRLRAVGKPVVLDFDEAITGKHISLQKDLRGKIVVLDFWATWCGPCVAEMPKMKDLYKEFHPQGVEFIGVSLDEPKDKGGLDSLKKYVKEKGIPWPQYYQGNVWEAEFSTSWGVAAIPRYFVIGPDGKVVSADARGKLETLLPDLIKKTKGVPNLGQ